MSDAKDYCDKTYKRLTGLKAGLYDVISRAEKQSDNVHSNEARNLMGLVDEIDSGLEELKNQCPADWSPNRKKIDESMARLSETLNKLADRLGTVVPDTTAWI